MKYTELQAVYRCDNRDCPPFVGRDVLLLPPVVSVEIVVSMGFPSLMCVDAEGNIIGTRKPQPDDRMLACPHCRLVHLFGFARADGDVKKNERGMEVQPL